MLSAVSGLINRDFVVGGFSGEYCISSAVWPRPTRARWADPACPLSAFISRPVTVTVTVLLCNGIQNKESEFTNVTG